VYTHTRARARARRGCKRGPSALPLATTPPVGDALRRVQQHNGYML